VLLCPIANHTYIQTKTDQFCLPLPPSRCTNWTSSRQWLPVYSDNDDNDNNGNGAVSVVQVCFAPRVMTPINHHGNSAQRRIVGWCVLWTDVTTDKISSDKQPSFALSQLSWVESDRHHHHHLLLLPDYGSTSVCWKLRTGNEVNVTIGEQCKNRDASAGRIIERGFQPRLLMVAARLPTPKRWTYQDIIYWEISFLKVSKEVAVTIAPGSCEQSFKGQPVQAGYLSVAMQSAVR